MSEEQRPADRASRAARRTAADEPATFTCSLDGRATPCTSPLRNAHLRSGAHRFEVRATDLAGNTDPTPAVQAWSIGPVAGVVAANPKPMKIMGPKLLRPRDLLKRNFKRTSSRPLRGGDESEQATSEDEPGDDDCRIVACAGAGTAAFGRRGLAPPTPGLTSGPFIVGTNSNDPHIAASSTHIVVTNNGVIRFFNKSGKLLAQDKNAGTVVGAFNAIDFFRSAWFTPSNPPTINDGLNLPTGLKCNPTISLFDGNQSKPGDQPLSANQQAETKWCLDTVYDTRVIFDDYNKRFWILSVVRNESEGTFQALFPPTLRVGQSVELSIPGRPGAPIAMTGEEISPLRVLIANNLLSWLKLLALPEHERNSYAKRLRFRFIAIAGTRWS